MSEQPSRTPLVSLRLLLLLLSLVPLFGAGCSSTKESPSSFVGGWEVIAADYSNVRGLNYVPDYPSIHDAPPGIQPGETYRGVASSVAIWRFYQRDDVRTQLTMLKQLGCNCVRLWLSSAAYEVEGDGFVAKVSEFFALAEAAHIYVIPVLFDWDFVEPDVTNRWGDIHDWVRNPSLAELEPGSDFRSRPRGGDEYVRAVVGALRGSPALLMWDIMNEPPPMDFLDHYLRLVKQLDPQHPTTIGWGGLPDTVEPGFANDFVAHPDLDVLSIHPYGIFYETFSEAVRRMRHINAASNAVPKPMLLSELGNPGGYQRYEVVLDYVAREGAQSGKPLGFCLWQAMVGDHRTSHPFKGVSGMLYADGTVRDLQGAAAFRDVAVRQGITGLPPVRQKPRSDPDWHDYTKPPLSPAQVVDFLRHWHDRRAPLRDENFEADGYRFQADLLTMVSTSLLWACRMPGGHGTEIAPADQELIQRRILEIHPRDLADADNLPTLLADGWILEGGANGYTIVWSRWEDLFHTVAAEWLSVIERNGLGG